MVGQDTVGCVCVVLHRISKDNIEILILSTYTGPLSTRGHPDYNPILVKLIFLDGSYFQIEV